MIEINNCKMKKLILILAVLFSMNLVACGSSEYSNTANDTTAVDSTDSVAVDSIVVDTLVVDSVK